MQTSPDLGDIAAQAAPLRARTPLSSVWATRRARALHLAIEVPAAEELMCTYAELLSVQARVAEAVPVRLWLALVSADAGPPRLRLDRLPVDELVPLFADFLSASAGLGGEVVPPDASALSGAPGASWLALIGAALSPDAPEEDPPFKVRAFLQPVATALAAAECEGMETAKGDRCLVCGAVAAVGATHHPGDDEPSRSLVCGMCGHTWRLPRAACAHCGEDDLDRLTMHAVEALPWVRVDACTTCNRYVKTIDLNLRPEAMPLVDDLATLELDRWARARGLRRAQENLFGL